MKHFFTSLFFVSIFIQSAISQAPKMMYSDTSGMGRPFSKDPMVIKFKGFYLLYYSMRTPGDLKNAMAGWKIGIAKSQDLFNWTKIGELNPAAPYESKGLCAPGAYVKNGIIHLFYQTYGNGSKDAICHAVSVDGINFKRDNTNPIFSPTGTWTNGRAIDGEVTYYKNKYFLYFATRDSSGKIQEQGVALARNKTNFNKKWWHQAVCGPILKPELPWEGKCIEAASTIVHNKKLYMFYAGNYNNAPQQIGVAVSEDGINWKKLSDKPFLCNGILGSWNSSESGHPCIFEDYNKNTWLFFQGNNDKGKTWYLSSVRIGWTSEGPFIIK
jgi:predicted GH43/DUF377 family glycosyl hydrolase